MDVPLRAGRTFRATDDHAGPLVVVISETLAQRIAKGGTAVGRRIRVRVPYLASFDDQDEMPWRTVIGVVADTKKDFASTNPTDVYVPYAQNPRSFESIVVRVGGPESAMAEPIKWAVADVDPDLALFDVESMDDVVADRGAQRRGLSMLLGVFAAFSLAVAALALYASLSSTVVQRRSELAIRLAIGASARSILRLVVAEGVVTGAAGLTAGALLSLGLGRVIENQLYGVGKADPLTLVSIALVLAGATVAACAVPSLRAMRTDPVLALRE
jgi:hypothetical protein